MPVVPKIEIPPINPSLALMVFLAISSPPGTLIVTLAPLNELLCISSVTIAAMFWRGIGLIAGPPTSSPNPGFVTLATPAPPSIATPGSPCSSTSAMSSAPCVQSGSSPASFTTLQRACVSVLSQRFSKNVTCFPLGSVVSISLSNPPVARQRAAALAAAAAQAPVVYPLRSPPRFRGGTLGSKFQSSRSESNCLRFSLLFLMVKECFDADIRNAKLCKPFAHRKNQSAVAGEKRGPRTVLERVTADFIK